jgi:hypothetical protein
VRPDLEDIAARLGALPGLMDLGITSNGIMLAKKLPGASAPRLSMPLNPHSDMHHLRLISQRCGRLA